METKEFNENLPQVEKLRRLKEAKGGVWYDGWRPYCMMCDRSGRMMTQNYGFYCPKCKNMIGFNLQRLQESPLNVTLLSKAWSVDKASIPRTLRYNSVLTLKTEKETRKSDNDRVFDNKFASIKHYGNDAINAIEHYLYSESPHVFLISNDSEVALGNAIIEIIENSNKPEWVDNYFNSL